MRIGILSFAHLHAEAYVNNLRAIPDVDLIGFADDNITRGQYFAKEFNLRRFDSYEHLLTEKPDGVIITSENTTHLPLVQMSAEASAHVLCEKPIATTLEDAQGIVDVCQRAGVNLMTAFPMRFSPPAVEIQQLVNGQSLGQIYGINGANQGSLPRFHQAEGQPNLDRDWFVDKSRAGGGAIMDHIVHLVDLLRWYLKSEVVEVYAETNQIFHGDEVDVETGGLVMLTFENGTFASLDCSWSKPPYYPTWGGLTMEIVSEKGLVTLDAFKQGLTVYRQSVGRPTYAPWGSDANQGMINEFIASIRGLRQPTITGNDGYKATEIVVAAYRSAQSGHPVQLPLDM